MASIVSKLARVALTTRASPSAVGAIAGGGRPAAAIRVFPAGGPKSEEEKAKPKSEVAPQAALIPHPKRYFRDDEDPFLNIGTRGYLDVHEKTLASKEAMWEFYEYWCKYHVKSRDRQEMARWFRIFSATARRVHTFNGSSVDGKAGMTRFADMTQKEIFPRSALRRTIK